MLEIEVKRFVASVRPLLAASTTKQGFAKALKENARPLVAIMRPRDEHDVALLDGMIVPALDGAAITPDGPVGRFVRMCVREVAMLPWQLAMFSSHVAGGGGPIASGGWVSQSTATDLSSYTYTSFSIPSGKNNVVLILAAGAKDRFGTAGNTQANSATADGNAMTKITGSNCAQESSFEEGVAIYAYALGDLPSGWTGDVVANWPETQTDESMIIGYLENASQTLPSTLVATDANTSGVDLSGTINSCPDGSLVISACCASFGVGPITATGTGQTIDKSETTDGVVNSAVSETPVSGTSNVTFGWSKTGGTPDRWAMCGACFQAA